MGTYGGCHSDSTNDLCDNASTSTIGSGLHCDAYAPPTTGWPSGMSGTGKRVEMILTSYPNVTQINANLNISNFQRNRVMYDSTITEAPQTGGQSGTGSSFCGRVVREGPSCNPPINIIYDYRPSAVSFEQMDSDTWFCYLFDMGSEGGTIGAPCFYIEEGVAATSGATNGDPDETETTSNCHPCTAFTATPKEASCSYTNPMGDETGDPDCPYPTVFGIGTLSNKIVFEYDAFSTVLPNGVLDVNFVYAPDSIDVDVWNETEYAGSAVITSQNTWVSGDEDDGQYGDEGQIVIFEGAALESGIKQGLRVKCRIAPVYNYDTSAFTGTRWTFMELMAPGQNYAVNDTYTLNYTWTHHDLTTSVITIVLKVTTVGPIEGTGSNPGFDALREGDTLNGHVITKTFHTEFDHFKKHLVYLDGNGSDFTYNTQYTSSRSHVVTVLAGKGVKTHSCLMGQYEFYDKSIQYTTSSIDGGSPDVYNTLLEPKAEGIITNGTITGFNVYDGGSGWLTLGKPPELVCTTPRSTTGKEAELEGTFTDGALKEILITTPGSGYTSTPTVTVSGNATAVAEVAGDDNQVNRIRITNHGSGYSADPTVTITGGGGTGAEASGYWGNGVLTTITIKNPGSGYSSADKPRAYVSNIFREDTVKCCPGMSTDDAGVDTFYDQLRSSGTFPEMMQALDRPEDKAVDELRLASYEEKETTAIQPNQEVIMDPTAQDIYTLPQRRYSKDKVDKLREVYLQYGNKTQDVKDMTTKTSDVTDEYKKEMANYRKKTAEAEQTREESLTTQCDNLSQESVPEYVNYPSVLVETVQRRFADLPHASTLTKYNMRQYRASTTDQMDLNVTIGCKVVESGCGHVTCPAPSTTAGGSTNNGNGSTTNTSYTMSGLLGPGADDWTASGKMRIKNNLTAASKVMGKCVDAYGNPFDI